MSDNTMSFLGIPIDGQIIRHTPGVEQKPLSELEPLIRAVLDDEKVAAFRWRQYTPYFNDGDPCEFGVGEVEFKPSPTVVNVKDECRFCSVGWGRHGTFGDGSPGEHQDTWARCRELYRAMNSNAFDEVLLDAFGDHATVTVTRNGIEVEFYEHD